MSLASMPRHILGKNGPSVAAIGIGTMNLSIPSYGKMIDDTSRFKFLDRALEIGATFWDTADIYGDGETLIGKWFKQTGKRNEIFLASKFGFVAGKPGDTQLGFDSSAKHCKDACTASLEKLGIDYIDLYYLHVANTQTPIEETMRALVELKTEGKIKYIGLSNVTANDLRRAYKIHPVNALQLEYSPFVRDIETEKGMNLLQACRELGVAVVCHSPLGRGILTSTFKDGNFGADSTDMRSKVFPMLSEANREANLKSVNAFAGLAEKYHCTVSQLSLAWLLKQGDDIFPIPGTKTIKYLEENVAAVGVRLTDEDEKAIREFLKENEIAGDRMSLQFKDIGAIDTKEEKRV